MFLFDGCDTKKNERANVCYCFNDHIHLFKVYGLGFELSYKLDLQGTTLYVTIANLGFL